MLRASPVADLKIAILLKGQLLKCVEQAGLPSNVVVKAITKIKFLTANAQSLPVRLEIHLFGRSSIRQA